MFKTQSYEKKTKKPMKLCIFKNFKSMKTQQSICIIDTKSEIRPYLHTVSELEFWALGNHSIIFGVVF